MVARVDFLARAPVDFLARRLDSPRLQRLVVEALASDGVTKIVDAVFDSGLVDHILERLLERPALWDLVEQVAQSPAVTAAISHQGLGFADQMAGEVRTRSRRADVWLERTTRRLAHLPGSDPA